MHPSLGVGGVGVGGLCLVLSGGLLRARRVCMAGVVVGSTRQAALRHTVKGTALRCACVWRGGGRKGIMHP